VTKTKAVLFDLDGVLVDATEWHYESLNRALGLFGFSINRYEHLSAYNGLPTRTKLEMLTVEKGLPRALHELIKRLKQVYTKEEILSKCWPVFEKEYMLSRLRREGYTLGVCSNAIRETVLLMLERSGVLKYLDLVLSNEDVRNPKPHPEIYLHAMERLGLQPGEVVIVEDAPHGIEAARRTGARVLEVAGFQEVDYWRLYPLLNGSSAEGASC
jgi:beta-phosphoglucomutase